MPNGTDDTRRPQPGAPSAPEALVFDRAVSDAAVRLYLVLTAIDTTRPGLFPTMSDLGDALGKSARTVPHLVKQLDDAGWIDRVPRFNPDGGRLPNGYTLHDGPVR